MKPKRVIITAGGSGIGLAIAQGFLAAGDRVAVSDIDPLHLEAAGEQNPGLVGYVADAGDPQAMEAFVGQACAELGGVDVLVNNAGIGGPAAAVEDIEYTDWDACIRVNLSGMFYAVRQVVPPMKQQRSGCIINIATASVRTGIPLRLPYVASKAGVLGLTHNLARELGPYNIRCNALLPGMIDNPRGRRLLESHAGDNGLSLAAAEEQFKQYISMRCWIDPSEIADAALFLASDAGRHVTAQEIAIDGNCEWEQ